MTANIKKMVNDNFKLHGYGLKLDATKYLVSLLTTLQDHERQRWLSQILDAVQKHSLDSNVLTKELVISALKECTHQEDDSACLINVIDAYNVPKFMYDVERKKFMKLTETNHGALRLFSVPDQKAFLYKDRYSIVQQRVLRHPSFQPQTFDAKVNQSKFELKTVESLKGSSNTAATTSIVLGMLTQLKHDKFYLEDPTGCVEMDLSNTSFHLGIFTENSLVLAEGSFDDDIFTINGLAQPPSELAEKTRAYFGNDNFFGGPSRACVKSSEKLSKLEMENAGNTLVFISDVFLDDVKVLDAMRRMLSDASEAPPIAFVICGNFCSKSYGTEHSKIVKDGFTKLGLLIAQFPVLLQDSQFIFVPGMQDPGIASILPRPPLAEFLTRDFKTKVPNCHFASNPCRIQYCSQEILVFREDNIHKMCRNAISMPTTDGGNVEHEITKQYAKTLISQSHLAPVPIHVTPIYWAYDHVMRLYPLPDLIVTADKFDSFKEHDTGCLVANPGSFGASNFTFMTYIPAGKELNHHLVE